MQLGNYNRINKTLNLLNLPSKFLLKGIPSEIEKISIKEKDASVIQRIGIYFREKKEYERACELLERVLEVRKRQFIQKKQQAESKNKDAEIVETPALDDEDDIEAFEIHDFVNDDGESEVELPFQVKICFNSFDY